MIIKVKDLCIDTWAREWCKLPYPNHPKGCPNYGRRASCPPEAPLIQEWANLDKPIGFAIVEFNLAEHIARMKRKHPNWSEAQLRCCLYWQGRVNKQLKDMAKTHAEHCGGIYTLCPEAMGVDVIKTTRQLGIPIEIKPTKRVFKIALIAYPKIRGEL